MVNVKNRWALITGANRGIGYLAAKFMTAQGCHLVLHGRTLKSTEKILREAKAMGVSAYAVSADLADADAVSAMLEAIDNLGVRIDIVLNNAGVQVAYRSNCFQTPGSDYAKSFAVNTIAPMMICYHFLPKMIEYGFGRIVNTTSGIALDPQQAGYSASKAALDKVTIDLGIKFHGTDVMISLTDPGWCRTDMGGQQAPNTPESAIPGVVLGAFVDDKKSGRLFPAQVFEGMALNEAVIKAEADFDSPYAKQQ